MAPASRPWPRGALLVLLLLFHAALLRWLSQEAPPRADARVGERTGVLRLLPMPTAPLQPPAPADLPSRMAARVPERPRASRSVSAAPAAPRAAEPRAVATDAPSTAGRITLPDAPPARASAASPHDAAQAPAPRLDLSLPAARLRAPAANPSREAAIAAQSGRGVPATMEARIANALGPGAWVLERIDNDTLRARLGSDCVMLKRSRVELIDPMVTTRAAPWLAGPC